MAPHDGPMTNPLHVLMVESEPGRGAAVAEMLTSAGHDVERCYPAQGEGFPCVGVIDPQACPIYHDVDVAVVVRNPSNTVTANEAGVSCAIRAGLPLVEVSDDPDSPFRGWASTVTDKWWAVDACEAAAFEGSAPLRREVGKRVDALLRRVGFDPASFHTTFVRQGDRLVVHVSGPTCDARVTQALSVRVLDGIRASGRTYGEVAVQVHG
jgi:hypothetical protein